MRIVHIAPNAPYNDQWGYQENLLPKYQRRLGHEVSVITTNKHHVNGTIEETEESDYYIQDNVHIYRKKWKQYSHPILTGINAYIPVIDLLRDLQPDFIFFHGLVSRSILDAVKYKKEINKDCIIVQDNHMDYYNSRSSKDIKGKIIRAYYRKMTRKTIRYVSRVYGVTPWRKQFAEEYFGVPSNKTDVLIMGADDEEIDFCHKKDIRKKIREQFHISSSEYLIVTGGKIDESKKIHYLAEAVNSIPGVRLVVFGEPMAEIKTKLEEIKSDRIDLIGWVPSNKTYEYFMAADLVCFPGTHSVMWEQACACKVPCLFARWTGMEHVNNGGNSCFIDDISIEGIRKKIENLIFTDEYYRMKSIAESEKTNIYLYSAIAKKSLETVEGHILC